VTFFQILDSLLLQPLQLLFEVVYVNANRVIGNPGLAVGGDEKRDLQKQRHRTAQNIRGLIVVLAVVGLQDHHLLVAAERLFVDSLLLQPLQLLFEVVYVNANRVIGNPGLSIIVLRSARRRRRGRRSARRTRP